VGWPLQLQCLASIGQAFGAGNPLWLRRGRGDRRRRGRCGRRRCLDEVRTRPLPLVHVRGRNHLREVGGGRKASGGPGRNGERRTATSGLRGQSEVYAVGIRPWWCSRRRGRGDRRRRAGRDEGAESSRAETNEYGTRSGRPQNPRLCRPEADSRFGPQIFFTVRVV
jgi:hypothetical protein